MKTFNANTVAVWATIRKLGGYQTNRAIAEATGLSFRSVRWLTYRMVNIGLIRARPLDTGVSNAMEYAITLRPPPEMVELADEHDAVASFRAKLRKQKKAG